MRHEVKESCDFINDVVASGETIYGVNTGFGQLSQARISDDKLVQLQENLVCSHAVGVGEDLDHRVDGAVGIQVHGLDVIDQIG